MLTGFFFQFERGVFSNARRFFFAAALLLLRCCCETRPRHARARDTGRQAVKHLMVSSSGCHTDLTRNRSPLKTKPSPLRTKTPSIKIDQIEHKIGSKNFSTERKTASLEEPAFVCDRVPHDSLQRFAQLCTDGSKTTNRKKKLTDRSISHPSSSSGRR